MLKSQVRKARGKKVDEEKIIKRGKFKLCASQATTGLPALISIQIRT